MNLNYNPWKIKFSSSSSSSKMLEDGARSVDDCRNYLAPKHARKHEAHLPRVKKRVRPYSNDLGFILAGKQHSQY